MKTTAPRSYLATGLSGPFRLGGALIKATYRVGGGPHGNVPAQTIQTIVEAPQLVLLGAKVSNPGGHRRSGTGKHRTCRPACPQRVPLAEARGHGAGL